MFYMQFFRHRDFYSDVYISRVYDIDGYDPSKFSIEPGGKSKSYS